MTAKVCTARLIRASAYFCSIILVVLASPAFAVELTFKETADGVILHYHNEDTFAGGTEDYRFSTSRGDLLMILTRTQNNACSPPCPDTLEITETPPGTVAIPPSIELPEFGNIDIRIVQFLGM